MNGKNVLQGICMPPDLCAKGLSPCDNVILGPSYKYEKNIIPVALKLSTGQKQKVNKELTQDPGSAMQYVASGFDLNKANQIPGPVPHSGIPATVVYSNESKEEVVVMIDNCKRS